MIFDNQSMLSDQQAITASAPSTNVIDLGKTGTAYGHAAAVKRDIGPGSAIPLRAQVTEAFTAGGAATLQVQLEVSATENFAAPKVVWQTPAIALADLKPGKVFVPEYITRGTDERYFRLNYVVASGPMTAGKITAGVTLGNQSNA